MAQVNREIAFVDADPDLTLIKTILTKIDEVQPSFFYYE